VQPQGLHREELVLLRKDAHMARLVVEEEGEEVSVRNEFEPGEAEARVEGRTEVLEEVTDGEHDESSLVGSELV
jgi:hypothetical protein